MRLRIFSLLALILCCGWPAAAQYPYIPVVQSQSTSSNSASITCVFDGNVTSGNYGIMLMSYFGTNNAPTVSDTRSSTYTSKLSDTSNSEKVAVSTTTFGSSGANTVTMAVTSGSFMNIQCIETKPLFSLTVDVSSVTSFSGSPATVTAPTITTTLNSDFIFNYFGNDNSAGWENLQAADAGTWYQIGVIGGADSQSAFFRIGGVAAAGNNITVKNGATQGTRVSIAFKSNAIAVTSASQAPDGNTTDAYNWCVLGAGGVGSYTWSVSSGALPTGLSFNTSTGCLTSRPTVSNNYTATLQVSDGTNTASKAISFKIATSALSISLVQSKATTTAAGTNPLAFTSNAASGNLILVNTGWNSAKAQISPCTDTLNTIFTLVNADLLPPLAGGQNPGYLLTWAGFTTSSGADTVACPSGAGNFMMAIAEYTNIQYVGNDNILYTRGATASPSTNTSSNFTPLVPNELLWGICAGLSGGNTNTVNSPATQIGSAFGSTTGYRILTTVTTYPFACAATLNSNTAWAISLAGFRPSGGTVVPPVSKGFPIVASLTKVAQN